MSPKSDFQSLIRLTTVAASTARDLARAAKVPFIGLAADLSQSIVETIIATDSSKDEYTEIVQQINELISAVLSAYESTQIDGILPPSVLYDIGKFTEFLKNIDSCLKAQRNFGRLRKLLKPSETEVKLRAYKVELQRALDEFRANSDRVLYGLANECLAYSRHLREVLPPAPQIFHGRDAELKEVINLLKQDSPRIAVLGPGGIGETSLAQAALHHLEVIPKYMERHFVPCNSSLTCADLVSNISSHLGFKNDRTSPREILQHFKCSEASLLVLDNLETTWESLIFRPEVENFLSLLADIPQLALVITMRGAQRPTNSPRI
ncbi:hypothetical protein FB451DRAFT_1495573 [Mycena latifolia]|nr:hypothetical protein FB451DRAFT_1495573 [Mycena latifolia]